MTLLSNQAWRLQPLAVGFFSFAITVALILSQPGTGIA